MSIYTSQSSAKLTRMLSQTVDSLAPRVRAIQIDVEDEDEMSEACLWIRINRYHSVVQLHPCRIAVWVHHSQLITSRLPAGGVIHVRAEV